MTIREFYTLIDVLVSPSRAEGYGLTLVEAAQAGIPAVTASWRLAPDILAMPLVRAVGYDLVPVRDPQHIYSDIPEARWAEPRLDEMARAVRDICFGGSADSRCWQQGCLALMAGTLRLIVLTHVSGRQPRCKRRELSAPRW